MKTDLGFHTLGWQSWHNRRLRGINQRSWPPIGKLVSVSFRVRVVRASERARRSCVGEWERSVCQRWASKSWDVLRPVVCGRGVFDAMFMVFFTFSHGLLLCSWVFWSFLVFDGMLMGFWMLLHTLFAFAAMLMGFLIFSCFWWYAHGVFDAFAYHVRFCCYAHGFFYLFLFLMVCSWVFWCFLHTADNHNR